MFIADLPDLGPKSMNNAKEVRLLYMHFCTLGLCPSHCANNWVVIFQEVVQTEFSDGSVSTRRACPYDPSHETRSVNSF